MDTLQNEWNEFAISLFINLVLTVCQNLCCFLRFAQKFISRVSDTILLCMRNEIFSRHTDVHIRKNYGWNLVLVYIWWRACIWHSDFRVCWDYLFSIFTVSYWTCLGFCILHTELSFQIFWLFCVARSLLQKKKKATTKTKQTKKAPHQNQPTNQKKNQKQTTPKKTKKKTPIKNRELYTDSCPGIQLVILEAHGPTSTT